MARKRWMRPGNPSGGAATAGLPGDPAVALAEYVAGALAAAGRLRMKTRPVDGLALREDERAALAVLPTLAAKLRKKLAKRDAGLTVAEVAGIAMAVAESFPDAEPTQQIVLLKLAGRLMASLQEHIATPGETAVARKSKSADRLYQIKVTLRGTKPPVWRRIRVEDCTLDELHAHVQTAMGWTNSHLHHFRVGDVFYGDPDLLADTFRELGYEDSTATKLSDLAPRGGKTFRFVYEYDFGDSWEHELVVGQVAPSETGASYPICLDGKRACPPEDVGGVWGYADFLDAVRDPGHEQHEELLEWVGGRFDPDKFDPAAATKRMRKGLPDWRRT